MHTPCAIGRDFWGTADWLKTILENLNIYDHVDYIAHYHCANFCGDRAIHGRDLKGGGPSFSSYQNSPVFLGLKELEINSCVSALSQLTLAHSSNLPQSLVSNAMNDTPGLHAHRSGTYSKRILLPPCNDLVVIAQIAQDPASLCVQRFLFEVNSGLWCLLPWHTS